MWKALSKIVVVGHEMKTLSKSRSVGKNSEFLDYLKPYVDNNPVNWMLRRSSLQ